jgi:hypothetical protein
VQLVVNQGQHLVDHAVVAVAKIDQELRDAFRIDIRHRFIVTFYHTHRNRHRCTEQLHGPRAQGAILRFSDANAGVLR